MMNYTSASIVGIEKVKFDSQIACGLRAKVRIEPFTTILSCNSSMSSDIVDGQRAISVIKSSPGQKGAVGPRLILGPFRFANHDCAPNCQVGIPYYPNIFLVENSCDRLSLSLARMRTPSSHCAQSTLENPLPSITQTTAPILIVRSVAARPAIQTPLQLLPDAPSTFQSLLKGQMVKEPDGVGKGKSGGRRLKVSGSKVSSNQSSEARHAEAHSRAEGALFLTQYQCLTMGSIAIYKCTIFIGDG
jgi:hypothetical protein